MPGNARLIFVISAKDEATKELQKIAGRLQAVSAGASKTAIPLPGFDTTNLDRDLSGIFGELPGVSQVSGVFGALTGGLIATGVAMGTVQAGRFAADLATTASQAALVRDSLTQLAGAVGQSGDAMVAALQAASRGTISEYDLMLTANRALLLGVADTSDEMAALMQVATARGRAMGLSTQEAFDNIVTGIGRMSPLILDNLGIVTGGQKVFDDYAAAIGKAADALTDAEKKQALVNSIIASSADIVAGTSTEADNAVVSTQRLSAAWADLKVELGESMVPIITPVIEAAIGVVRSAQAELARQGAATAITQGTLATGYTEPNKMKELIGVEMSQVYEQLAEAQAELARLRSPEGQAREMANALTLGAPDLFAAEDTVKKNMAGQENLVAGLQARYDELAGKIAAIDEQWGYVNTSIYESQIRAQELASTYDSAVAVTQRMAEAQRQQAETERQAQDAAAQAQAEQQRMLDNTRGAIAGLAQQWIEVMRQVGDPDPEGKGLALFDAYNARLNALMGQWTAVDAATGQVRYSQAQLNILLGTAVSQMQNEVRQASALKAAEMQVTAEMAAQNRELAAIGRQLASILAMFGATVQQADLLGSAVDAAGQGLAVILKTMGAFAPGSGATLDLGVGGQLKDLAATMQGLQGGHAGREYFTQQSAALSEQTRLWLQQGYTLEEINDYLLPNYIGQLNSATDALTRHVGGGGGGGVSGLAQAYSDLQGRVSGALSEALNLDVGVNPADFLPREDAINENARRLAAIMRDGFAGQEWLGEFKAEVPALFDELVNSGDIQGTAARILQQFAAGMRPELIDREAVKARVKAALLGEASMAQLAAELSAELMTELSSADSAAVQSEVAKALGLNGGTEATDGVLAQLQGAGFQQQVSTAGGDAGKSWGKNFLNTVGSNVPGQLISILVGLVTPGVRAQLAAEQDQQGARP